MTVTFKGFPPHDLGLAEIATAELASGHVEVTLHVLDDWHSPNAIPVRVQMTRSVALALADRLAAAATISG